MSNTIKYKGMILEEATYDKAVVFESPRRAVVWDTNKVGLTEYSERNVVAIIPYLDNPVVTENNGLHWGHCAFLDATNTDRATKRELSLWLSMGFGEATADSNLETAIVTTHYDYRNTERNTPVTPGVMVRKWEDTEWHEPTKKYMGLKYMKLAWLMNKADGCVGSAET